MAVGQVSVFSRFERTEQARALPEGQMILQDRSERPLIVIPRRTGDRSWSILLAG